MTRWYGDGAVPSEAAVAADVRCRFDPFEEEWWWRWSRRRFRSLSPPSLCFPDSRRFFGEDIVVLFGEGGGHMGIGREGIGLWVG